MFAKIKDYLWSWPYGVVWKKTEKLTIALRRERFELFMNTMKPKANDKILDVGVHPFQGRGFNYLEMWYPYPGNITALTVNDLSCYKDFREKFPNVHLIKGDGRKLDFPDNFFDIGFSSAVVEHVGDRKKQELFIHELCRVSKRCFVTTPNYYFPIESHSLIPFVQFLPIKIRYWVYRKCGRESCASIDHLNLLRPGEFLSLFPKRTKVRLFKQRFCGITSNLFICVHDPESDC